MLQLQKITAKLAINDEGFKITRSTWNEPYLLFLSLWSGYFLIKAWIKLSRREDLSSSWHVGVRNALAGGEIMELKFCCILLSRYNFTIYVEDAPILQDACAIYWPYWFQNIAKYLGSNRVFFLNLFFRDVRKLFKHDKICNNSANTHLSD